jgi:formylglycine-generating enzyme required for sulfatase activity
MVLVMSEWVQDIYRPLSFQDFEDLNPIRRDDFLDEAPSKENPNAGRYDNRYKNPTSFNSLITNTIRVYKGASWNDHAYWVSPGTRRFLEQDSATATIGFRCAMIRAGTNR